MLATPNALQVLVDSRYAAAPRPREDKPMREILSAEQPCILCGQCLHIVTVMRDEDDGREIVARVDVPHSQENCLSFARLYSETWPNSAVSG
jgi:ferredoxin